jgi:hypothetical protein
VPARAFLVARNPEPGSTLPYLIRLPCRTGRWYSYKFAGSRPTPPAARLPADDYAVALDDEPVATVERKSPADLAHALVDGGLAEEWTFRFLGAALAHARAESSAAM